MKVLFVGPKIKDPQTGGSRYLSEILQYLANQKVEVRFMGLPNSWKIGWKGLLSTNLYYLKQFLKVNKRKDFILLEDYGIRAHNMLVFNYIIRAIWKNKLLILVQSFYFPSQKSTIKKILDKWISRLFLRQADLVIGGGGQAIMNSVRKMGIPEHRIRSINPGIDRVFIERESILPRQAMNREQNLLFVGRVHRNKGLEYLIEALYLLRHEPWHVTMVGDTSYNPSYGKRIKSMICALGIADKISCLGRITDVSKLREIYQQADIFVLPSVEECYPFVLLEAMSVGLPIIATDVAAIPEIVEDGVQGIIVPSKDPQALADAIRRLIHDAKLRKLMSRNSFKRSTYLFRKWHQVGKEFYETILETFATMREKR